MTDAPTGEHLRQRPYAVRFDWGAKGAAALHDDDGCLVVVDVLSFTTAVTVATGRGMAILPYGLGADPAGAAAFAAAHGAELAVGRHEVSADHPWSLSPAGLAAAPATARLVLPSPNGSAIAAAAASGAAGTVVAACLRNASAVAAWVCKQGYATGGGPVTVIGAGERWPDGSLRPALEDALGAGAVLDGLQRQRCRLSPEAEVAAAAYRGTADVAGAVHACASGLELAALGFGADVDVAIELDCDNHVSVLHDDQFTAVRPAAAAF